MIKKCYVVYTYDTMPHETYTFNRRVFMDKKKAKAFVKEANKQAWKDKEDYESKPDHLFDIQEVDIEL